MKRPIKLIIAIGMAIVICVVCRFVWNIVTRGTRAEMQIQSVKFVAVLVIHHIETFQEWPRGWDDLQRDSAITTTFVLPQDQLKLNSYIEINGDISLRDVAQMTPEHFDAIRLRDDAFYNYASIYSSIIEAAKQALIKRGDGAAEDLKAAGTDIKVTK